MTQRVIVKVWKNKGANQKLITVPKDCDIEAGDYIQLIKIGDDSGDQNG